MKLIILSLIFVGTSIALNLDEIQNFKTSLDEELLQLEVENLAKKEATKDMTHSKNKIEDSDSSLNNLVKALIKDDIEDSIKEIKSNKKADEKRNHLQQSMEHLEKHNKVAFLAFKKLLAKENKVEDVKDKNKGAEHIKKQEKKESTTVKKKMSNEAALAFQKLLTKETTKKDVEKKTKRTEHKDEILKLLSLQKKDSTNKVNKVEKFDDSLNDLLKALIKDDIIEEKIKKMKSEKSDQEKKQMHEKKKKGNDGKSSEDKELMTLLSIQKKITMKNHNEVENSEDSFNDLMKALIKDDIEKTLKKMNFFEKSDTKTKEQKDSPENMGNLEQLKRDNKEAYNALQKILLEDKKDEGDKVKSKTTQKEDEKQKKEASEKSDLQKKEDDKAAFSALLDLLSKDKRGVKGKDVEENDEVARSMTNLEKRGLKYEYHRKSKIGQVTVAIKMGCEDKIGHCDTMKPLCDTERYGTLMKRDCAKTCEFCSECVDVIPKRCRKIPKAYCKVPGIKEKMMKYCAETCGCGKTHSPPACVSSKLGCCWDKVTSRTMDNPDGDDGCPECCEKRPRVCKLFLNMCRRADTTAGKWMKYNCPMTCGFCVAKDLEEELCHWAAKHKCTIDYKDNKSIKALCPKTCPGYCKKPSRMSGRYGRY